MQQEWILAMHLLTVFSSPPQLCIASLVIQPTTSSGAERGLSESEGCASEGMSGRGPISGLSPMPAGKGDGLRRSERRSEGFGGNGRADAADRLYSYPWHTPSVYTNRWRDSEYGAGPLCESDD